MDRYNNEIMQLKISGESQNLIINEDNSSSININQNEIKDIERLFN